VERTVKRIVAALSTFTLIVGCGAPEPWDEVDETEQAVYVPGPLPEVPDERPDDPDADSQYCGNHRCDPSESCLSCAADCGTCPKIPESTCGDFVCHASAGETCSTCPGDCGKCCGNGKCDYNETGCTCPLDCGPTCNVGGKVTVSNLSIPKFIPPWTGQGDLDFAGNGPMVAVSASIRPVGNAIYADVYMVAVESTGDRTRAEGKKTFKIYTHSKQINYIISDTFTSGAYTDSNIGYYHPDDYIFTRSGELVQYFKCTGDVAGDDAGVATGCSAKLRGVTFLEQ